MKKKRVTKALSRAALHLAEGVFSYSVDMTLWLVAYAAVLSTPFQTYGKAWRAQWEADRFLNQINYDVIKNALITARRRGFLKKSRRHAEPAITAAGKRRLAGAIPAYDPVRTWDSRLHLVTYDIPEKRRSNRDLLREHLRTLGCGMLQESVWITPYNPIDTLRLFIADRALEGTVIVSDMGKDGSIGEEDVGSLVARVWKLATLNERYEKWLADVDTHGLDHLAGIQYLSILADDPQLPFALLPSWWKGEKAYREIQSLFKKLSI